MILGSSVLFQLAFAPARGVINGCHRWDITNLINVTVRIVSALGMITMALTTARLVDLAWAYLIVSGLGETIRYGISLRVLPEAKIGIGLFSWKMARRMFHFGVYQNLLEIAPVLLFQAVNILVTHNLGAASLAVLVRYLSLVKYIEMFINRFSRMLSPSTAALCAMDKQDELRRFFVDGSRYAASLALPMLVMFGFFGDRVVGLWMGSDYIDKDLVSVLAIGYCLPVLMGPAQSVLIGMYAHARVTRLVMLALVTGFSVGYVVLDFIGWSLERAALMETITLSLSFGVIVPVVCCRRLGIRLVGFLVEAYSAPMACVALFSSGLFVADHYMGKAGDIWWLTGLLTSLVILGLSSWYWILPFDIRKRMRDRLFLRKPLRQGR